MSETIQTKRCSHCKQFKPISEFHKNRTTQNGYQSECKFCQSKSSKKYLQTERGKDNRKSYLQTEKYKTGRKRYRQTERCKVSMKRHYQTEKYKVNQKHRRQSEKYKAYQKRYSILHPEYWKAVSAVNYAIRKGKLPRPDSLPCYYGEHPAQQYHHYLGYAPEHLLDVIPVCKKCHIFHHRKVS